MPPSPLAQPALFPPADGKIHTWPKPNYVNPETRDWTAPACLIVLFIITSGVFFARLQSRFRTTRTAGIDDWLIIASMPILLGQVVATVLALRIYGFQLHIYDQTPHTYLTVRQITLAMEVIYLATTTLTKTSILAFHHRMAPSLISRPVYITLWASIIFVLAYGITFIFVLVFTCWPVEAYWYRFTASWLQTHHYKCHDELITLLLIIPISAAQDFIACLLPMFVVRKLKLQLMQKLGLSAIFGVGLITCAIGSYRVYLAWRVYHYTKMHSQTYDITWEALGSWVSTTVEANLAILCASAPALSVYFPCFRRTHSEDRSFGWYRRRRGPGVFTVASASQ